MKAETIQIDKVGRVTLPKWLRDNLGLIPGDKLQISVEGHGFKIESLGAPGEFVRKGGVLVFTGQFSDRITVEKINEIIDLDRHASFERHLKSEAYESHSK